MAPQPHPVLEFDPVHVELLPVLVAGEVVGGTVADSLDGSFSAGRLLDGIYNIVVSAEGYDDLTVSDLSVTPPAVTDRKRSRSV